MGWEIKFSLPSKYMNTPPKLRHTCRRFATLGRYRYGRYGQVSGRGNR